MSREPTAGAPSVVRAPDAPPRVTDHGGVSRRQGTDHGGVSRRRPTVVIAARAEQRMRAGHPWIYRSDLKQVDADAGDVVRVVGRRGRALGYGLFSDRSVIALRMVTRADRPPDTTFWRERLADAVRYREQLAIDATAYRLVHGEGDRLPSLIVDRYADVLVVQTLSQGMDRQLPLICELLADIVRPRGILARNDPKVRGLEGLDRTVDLCYGEVPDVVEVREGPVTLLVEPRTGQKTGLFLDQRENRATAARYAKGRGLDCFSYTGAFALRMAPSCVDVTAVEVSDDTVARVARNAERNGITNIHTIAGNAFDVLRELDRRGDHFETIVLDPPAFAKNRGATVRAYAGYREINLRALKLLTRGGTLITSSCSYHVDEPTFGRIVAEAAADARADVIVVEKRCQSRDHPVLAGVPETSYLKCLVLRKI